MPGVKFVRRGARRGKAADGDLLPLAAPREEGFLLGSDASWSELWRGMPAYEMGSTEAHRRVTIHLRDAEEVAELGRMLGMDLTDRTETIWLSRDEDYVAPKELLYASDDPRPPRYPVYVISKGRWETPWTAEALRAIGVPHKVVVEPSEATHYVAALGEERLIIAPEDFSRRGEGGIPVRNYVWELALATGARRHWILDDNVHGFLRLHRNRRIPVAGPSIFRAAEDFTDRYDNVAFSGFNYMYLAPDRGELPPFYLNTRVYSMILVDNALPYRWRGRYNEDTDICLRALKDGLCTVLFNAFLGDKAPTLTMKGGNASIYAESDNRREFAESLKRQHPDVVEVVWRYGRWHHEVDYRPFAANRLVPRRDRPLDGGEYGMRLVREHREARYPTAAPAAVVLGPKRGAGSGNDASPQKKPSWGAGSEINPLAGVQQAVAISPRASRVLPAPANLHVRSREKFSDPFLAHHAATLDAAGDAPLALDGDSWDYGDPSPVGLDVESFGNFFLVALKRFSDGRRAAFELSDRRGLDVDGLRRALGSACLVTFNGGAYDLPLAAMALDGAPLDRLKLASDRIILGGLRPWDVEREFGVRVPRWDHVDLFEPNPSTRQGLKTLAARLHARFLVDLPFDPAATLSPREMNVATLYCLNDLDHTQLLFEALREPLELRHALSAEHGVDLRSRSDAQIGEAIVRRRVEAATGERVPRPSVAPREFRYTPPPWISFGGRRAGAILALLADSAFRVDEGGNVHSPEWLGDATVEVGSMSYSIGIGGLHSTEGCRAVRADAETALVDVDVSSQYPRIILSLGLYPPALGPAFLGVYRAIVEERLAAKAAGNKVKADGLKISANGVFGKLGSPHSPLYAPELMTAVTLTGQLSILMLVERLEAAGARVVSANTDGVTYLAPCASEEGIDAVVRRWEGETEFELERTRYRALFSSSVNSYVAIREDGKVKRKGPAADPWSEGDARGVLTKNPQMTVLSRAVVALARDAIPLEQTIRSCRDPRMFLTAIKVTGGAAWRGHRLGRVVRYYWSTDGDPILYITSGRKVAKTDGAAPLIELTDRLPPDLDLDRYVREARRLAIDLAVVEEGGILSAPAESAP